MKKLLFFLTFILIIPSVTFANNYGITYTPTDSTNIAGEINNIINSLPNGGTIFIPKGEYIINQPIIINKRGIRICGEGMEATTFRCSSSFEVAGGRIIYIDSRNDQTQNENLLMIEISNIRLMGTTASYNEATNKSIGITLGNTAGSLSDSQPNFTWHVKISRVYFVCLKLGIDFNDISNENTIENCFFFDLYQGIKADPKGSHSFANHMYLSNEFQGIRDWAIQIKAGTGFLFQNNVFQGGSTLVNTKGILLDHVNSVTISSNYFEYHNSDGPAIYAGVSAYGESNLGGLKIDGNNFNFGNNQNYWAGAIRIDYFKGVVISNNSFRGMKRGIMLWRNADNILILPNSWDTTTVPCRLNNIENVPLRWNSFDFDANTFVQ